jgi:peroxiredoxin Q/BCP
MLNIKDKAPLFTLINQDDKEISLKDYFGKWIVLYFYPKDNTPGCTIEACSFTDNLKDFKKLDAIVIGISADSPQSHRNFIKNRNLKITLLSDPSHNTLKKYEAFGEKNFLGKISIGILRSTFLIDPEGNIAYIWRNVKAEGHAKEVKAKLEELKI